MAKLMLETCFSAVLRPHIQFSLFRDVDGRIKQAFACVVNYVCDSANSGQPVSLFKKTIIMVTIYSQILSLKIVFVSEIILE